MKKIKLYTSLAALSCLSLLSSCSDFTDVNTDPKAANVEQVQVEYILNSSIYEAQMNPHIAERVFVLYWKTAGRQQRASGIATGSYMTAGVVIIMTSCRDGSNRPTWQLP